MLDKSTFRRIVKEIWAEKIGLEKTNTILKKLDEGDDNMLAVIEMIREEVKKNINGYIAVPEIVWPALGDNAGVIGAIELGKRYQRIVEMWGYKKDI